MLNHYKQTTQQENTVIEISNEFGSVRLVRDMSGNGPRLMLKNMMTGSSCYLDPFELQCLVGLPEHIREMIVDPRERWK